nr:MAG TPA: hypothetical protein [Caudoviricetes sp.]
MKSGNRVIRNKSFGNRANRLNVFLGNEIIISLPTLLPRLSQSLSIYSIHGNSGNNFYI